MIERVRAIIIEKQWIILIKRVKPAETFWVVPGGAVESDETHQVALKREIEEEVGVKIEVGKLFYRGISSKPQSQGQAEHYYECKIISGQLGTGHGPEFQPNSYYIGLHMVEWVELSRLKDLEFKPKEVRDLLYKMYYNKAGGN